MKVPDAVFGDDEGDRWEASVVAVGKDWAELHFDADGQKHRFTLSEARQWLVSSDSPPKPLAVPASVEEDEGEEQDGEEQETDDEEMMDDAYEEESPDFVLESARKALREAEAEGLTLERADVKSGYKHVYKKVDTRGGSNRARYQVHMNRGGRRQSLGTFDTAEQAALMAAREVAQPSAHGLQERAAVSAGAGQEKAHTSSASDAAQEGLAREVLQLHQIRAALQGSGAGAPFDRLRDRGYFGTERELPDIEAGWRVTGHRHIGQLARRRHGQALVLVLVAGWLPPGVCGSELFKVVHADGDAEDLDEGEARCALALWRFEPHAAAAVAQAEKLAAPAELTVAVRQATQPPEASECTAVVVASTASTPRSPSPLEETHSVRSFASSSSDRLAADPLAATLRDKFKHDGFRGQQRTVIEAVLEKRDALVVWPTDRGKSLCYQLAAVHTGKLAIVVQPNISLMDNQMDELNALATKCGEAPWASVLHCEDKTREHDVLSGRFRVVCVSEQRALRPTFMDQLSALHKKGGLLLVAVDEAHVISECSVDYRDLYRQLSKLRQALPNVPFLALTATATPEVRDDIIKTLKLRQPFMAVESIYRPELHLAREPRPQGPGKVVARVVQLLHAHGTPAIIYVHRVREAQSLLKELRESCELTHLIVDTYHGSGANGAHKVDPKERRRVQEDFLNGTTDVIVATEAFGLGINKYSRPSRPSRPNRPSRPSWPSCPR